MEKSLAWLDRNICPSWAWGVARPLIAGPGVGSSPRIDVAPAQSPEQSAAEGKPWRNQVVRGS